MEKEIKTASAVTQAKGTHADIRIVTAALRAVGMIIDNPHPRIPEHPRLRVRS